jgi:alcohol-forming fatty acyl-CoA reductase
VVISRPTIIGAAYREPIGGWVDTISAAGVIQVACGMGIVNLMQGMRVSGLPSDLKKVFSAHISGDENQIGDQVPVDMVTNVILTSCMLNANRDKVSLYYICTAM